MMESNKVVVMVEEEEGAQWKRCGYEEEGK